MRNRKIRKILSRVNSHDILDLIFAVTSITIAMCYIKYFINN